MPPSLPGWGHRRVNLFLPLIEAGRASGNRLLTLRLINDRGHVSRALCSGG
jgi:hypothetical protein